MANEIRRSETRKQNYDRYVAAAEKAAQASGPRFGEDGKAATYQERDAAQLPAFTSNLITLSNISKPETREASVREASLHRVSSDELWEREMAVRSAMRHALAGDLDQSTDEALTEEADPEAVEIEASSVDHREVIASIAALAPEAKVGRDGSFNRIVAGTVATLVRGLQIEAAKREWLAAQAEEGLRDDKTFVRDVRAAVAGNSRVALLNGRIPGRGFNPDEDLAGGPAGNWSDISGVTAVPGLTEESRGESSFESEFDRPAVGMGRKIKPKRDLPIPDWAKPLAEKLLKEPEVRGAVRAGDTAALPAAVQAMYPQLEDGQLADVVRAVSELVKKIGKSRQTAREEAPVATASRRLFRVVQ